MITRAELKAKLESMEFSVKDRIKSCQAWACYYGNYVILQSYKTNVALFNKNTGTVFVLDYYSNTTCQHVRKFIEYCQKEWNVSRVTYLYRRNDRIIEEGISNYSNTYKLTASEYRKVQEEDFITYIGSLKGLME